MLDQDIRFAFLMVGKSMVCDTTALVVQRRQAPNLSRNRISQNFTHHSYFDICDYEAEPSSA